MYTLTCPVYAIICTLTLPAFLLAFLLPSSHRFLWPRQLTTQASWLPRLNPFLRRVRTTKPGWCGLKANRIYPGWIRVAHVRTQSGLMRVQRTWTVWATSRRLKRTTKRAPVARLSVYSALQRSKNALGARARSAPFLTQFQPTWTHIRMWVGWTRVQPGFTKSGLSADSQYPSSIRVRALVRTCL